MATGLYAGDPTSYPANVRFAEDGEQPNSATIIVPTVEDHADREAWLKERVSGGKRAHHGALSTNGAGAVSTEGGSANFTPTISGNFVRVTFAAAKAAATYSVTCSIEDAASPAIHLIYYGAKTTTTVDFMVTDLAGTAVNLGTTAMKFSFRIADAE